MSCGTAVRSKEGKEDRRGMRRNVHGVQRNDEIQGFPCAVRAARATCKGEVQGLGCAREHATSQSSRRACRQTD
eukprot:7503278-Pyramimonas_sp.AAC.1